MAAALDDLGLRVLLMEKALTGELGAETIFRQAPARLPRCWDLALVDCPPSVGLLSVSALVAPRGMLVAIEAQDLPWNTLSLPGIPSHRAWTGVAPSSVGVETIRRRVEAGLLAARTGERGRYPVEVPDAGRAAGGGPASAPTR